MKYEELYVSDTKKTSAPKENITKGITVPNATPLIPKYLIKIIDNYMFEIAFITECNSCLFKIDMELKKVTNRELRALARDNNPIIIMSINGALILFVKELLKVSFINKPTSIIYNKNSIC